MKHFNTLLLFALLMVTSVLTAQEVRYLDEVFDEVQRETGVIYATNISILSGMPEALDLEMHVYTPVGDTETERPVVIYTHTGSYLPQYFNGQVTGGLLDSTVVEVCTRLAKQGYTAIAATYRQGWLPLSDDQNTRTESLLQAVWRSIQDIRSCVRYLRKTAAEDGNPYGIDPDKVAVWGQGTGGYIAFACAYIDRYEEVVLDKFINTSTAIPYVLEDVHGDPYGLMETPLNLVNWPGYSSDIQFSINMGGALGDISWVEGDESPVPEPPTIGFHPVTDPFAPFGNGPVIVPTTDEFVVNVSGTRTTVARANELGVNDPLNPVLTLGDELSTIVADLEDVPVDQNILNILGQEPTTHATPHMYPFLSDIDPNTGLLAFSSGPWDWWDVPTLTAVIAGINAAIPTANLDANQLHEDGLITNPMMSRERAVAYIDTIMAYYSPRACFALGLEECVDFVLSSEELVTSEMVDFQMAPNPAADYIMLQSGVEDAMIDIQLFDQVGRLVSSKTNVNDNSYQLNRSGLPSGMYYVKIRFDKGTLTERIMFK